MCRRTLYLNFLVLGRPTDAIKVVVDAARQAEVAAEDGSVQFRLPTAQQEAPLGAPIRAFLTRNVRPGEQEPDVLLHRDCTEITAVSRQDSVALYIDDFQRTQIELGELMIRVGYYFVV